MGTVSRRVAANPGENWWLPGEKSDRLFRVGAGCWSPRAGPVPGRPLNLRRARTLPNCLRRRSRRAPRQPETHRRLSSRSVFVTGIENARRSDASLRCRLAAAHITQPRVDGGFRGDSLQLTTKELLHGLAIERRTHRQFVANCFRHSPDGDLYGHAVMLTALKAIGKRSGPAIYNPPVPSPSDASLTPPCPRVQCMPQAWVRRLKCEEVRR